MVFNLFSRRVVKGDGFTVTLGGRGALTYEEGTHRFLVNVLEGNGYGIVVENMAVDLTLSAKSPEEKRRIALNIKRALEKRGITVDIYQGNRVVID